MIYVSSSTVPQVSKNWDLCKAARLRGCEAYANSGGLFHAAKQLEEALLICKEEKNMTEVQRYK